MKGNAYRRLFCLGPIILVAACGNTVSGDWLHYNRDSGSTRYSPLAQINRANVAELELAWTFAPGQTAEKPDDQNQQQWAAILALLQELNVPAVVSGVSIKAVPVVVDGVMYLPAHQLVFAVEAASGAEIWRYVLPEGDLAGQWGVNYWPGSAGIEPRIFFTSSSNLIALDAATGEPAAGFGVDGMVDLGVEWRGVPVVVGNIIAVGATVLETPQDPHAPGDTRGFDAVTGELRWVFHNVPRPGEVGHHTWLDEGWRNRSGTNVWGPHMTVDEELDLLYFPVGGPATNYYGGDRPGDNLFGNSIVAVQGSTGKYRWHFQLVHHDIWDYDNPPAPALIDIERAGEKVPAIAQVGKTGWMFILDRRTGKPIFGVEERAVPAGDVPGEWYSPTQPFPVKPPALAKTAFSTKDIVTANDTTQEHVDNCMALLKKSGGFYNEGPFTPFLFHKDGTPPRSTILFPSAAGGTNWGGVATDQQTGYVFAYSQNIGSIGWTMKKKAGVRYPTLEEAKSNLPYTRASVNGHGPHDTFSASAGKGMGSYPCQKPPWGQMSAVNANTGDIVWQRPIGIAERLPPGKQQTGLARGTAGPTATAGGLLFFFFAGLSDGRLRALDSRNGDELWSADLGVSAITQPVTFLGSDKRQYVAISVGGTVKAFALP